MKALRLESIGRLELAEVERPSIHADEILIRTGASTICTSDLHDIRSNPFNIDLPMIIGHESAGTVVEAGSSVTGFQLGDRIAAHPVHPCGRCSACTNGMGHLCLDMGHFGLNLQGTFADYFVVRADRARVLPPGMDFEVGALMEPVCVSLEALRQARLAAGQSLLIIGDGPFGVLMARLAARLDLAKVVLAGHQDFRLAFAHAAIIVNTHRAGDTRAMLIRESGGIGYDAVILAVAAREAVADAIEVLRPKGRLVIFAPLSGETGVDLFRVLLNELEIVGSVNDPELMDEAVQALADPDLGLSDMVTHRFTLQDYRQAFTLAETGQHEAMKVAIVFAPVVA